MAFFAWLSSLFFQSEEPCGRRRAIPNLLLARAVFCSWYIDFGLKHLVFGGFSYPSYSYWILGIEMVNNEGNGFFSVRKVWAIQGEKEFENFRRLRRTGM